MCVTLMESKILSYHSVANNSHCQSNDFNNDNVPDASMVTDRSETLVCLKDFFVPNRMTHPPTSWNMPSSLKMARNVIILLYRKP